MKHYILSVLVAFDQFINALTGGYPNETISYRASINAQLGGRWGCILCKFLEWIDPGHCDLTQPTKTDKLSRGATYLSEHNAPQDSIH